MIASIGAFDGFHRGHQDLLACSAKRAEESGSKWGVVTFTHHPDSFFAKKEHAAFKSLFTINEQRLLEKYFSAPVVRRINFTRKISGMAPDEFLDFIGEKFGVRGVVVGEDFRFGKNRGGNIEDLRKSCVSRDWSLDVIPMRIGRDGRPISSTLIRGAVSDGEMRRAWDLLGYPFFYLGKVVHGNRRGSALGFPTANIEQQAQKIDVRGGVYATVSYCGAWRIGAANVGFNPTFGDISERRFEINLLGYDGNLYGREIAVFLLDHIRDEIRFNSEDALKDQIARDSEIIRRLSSKALESHRSLWEKFESLLEGPNYRQETTD
jgi:riboflavin kinase/FMN adenylyltransferase